MNMFRYLILLSCLTLSACGQSDSQTVPSAPKASATPLSYPAPISPNLPTSCPETLQRSEDQRLAICEKSNLSTKQPSLRSTTQGNIAAGAVVMRHKTGRYEHSVAITTNVRLGDISPSMMLYLPLIMQGAPVTLTPLPPNPRILDSFAQEDGGLSSYWLGHTDGYTIRAQQVKIMDDGLILYDQVYADNQHAFVTLNTINFNGEEIDLILKAQGTGECDLLKVWYMPLRHRVGIATCANGVWKEHSLPFELSLEPGDRFGARAYHEGTVNIYKNDRFVDRYHIDDWPFSVEGGRIGIWTLGAVDMVIDDFGGGSLP